MPKRHIQSIIEYGFNVSENGCAHYNPFNSNFETAEKAVEAGIQYLAMNDDATDGCVFELVIEKNQIISDDTVSYLSKYDPRVKALMGIELVITAAEAHAESEPEHQIGDLKDAVRQLWKILTPEQQAAFMASDEVRDRLENHIPNAVFEALYDDEPEGV